jgi:hypothetical protein
MLFYQFRVPTRYEIQSEDFALSSLETSTSLKGGSSWFTKAMCPPSESVGDSTNETSQTKSSPLMGFLAFLGIFVVLIAFNVSLLFATFWYPQTVGLYLVLPYYMYVLFISQAEIKDGGRWDWFSKNFVAFKEFRKFLQIRFIVDDKLKAAQAQEGSQFIFGVFPHGSNADFRIAIDGMLPSILPNVAKSLRVLAATVLFRIPIVRELCLWTGCVDARRSVAENLLKRGRSLLILPGGQAEQLRTVHGREIVFLQKRKGFVKLAMKHGVPVVPVYVFGVSDYYHTSPFAHDFRMWLLKTMGIAIPLAWGIYGSSISPLPVPTTLVFGKPLHFSTKQVGSPSPEEVDSAHDEFCTSLRNLFDAHKKSLGYGDRTLEIE